MNEQMKKEYIAKNYRRSFFKSQNSLLNLSETPNLFKYKDSNCYYSTIPYSFGYDENDFSIFDSTYVSEEVLEYTEGFSRYYHGVVPKEINYQKYIEDICDFTSRKIFNACQKLKKYSDTLFKANKNERKIIELKRELGSFFTFRKRKDAIRNEISLLEDRNSRILAENFPDENIISREDVFLKMENELDLLKQNVDFLNNLNIFIRSRMNNIHDNLYSDGSRIIRFYAGFTRTQTGFIDLRDRKYQREIINLESSMCQDKLIKTYNRWANIINKKRLENHFINEEKNEIDLKLAKLPFHAEPFDRSLFIKKIEHSTQSPMLDFEKKEIQKQSLGTLLWDYSIYEGELHEKEPGFLHTDIKNDRDRFAFATQTNEVREAPRKNFLERFISWVRS